MKRRRKMKTRAVASAPAVFSRPDRSAWAHKTRAPRSELSLRTDFVRELIRSTHGLIKYREIVAALQHQFPNTRSMDFRLMKQLFKEEGYSKTRSPFEKRIIAALGKEPRVATEAPVRTMPATAAVVRTTPSAEWEAVAAALSSLMRAAGVTTITATLGPDSRVKIEIPPIIG